MIIQLVKMIDKLLPFVEDNSLKKEAEDLSKNARAKQVERNLESKFSKDKKKYNDTTH